MIDSSKMKVLYTGDTQLTEAASYLAGVMTHFGIEFDYVCSLDKMTDEILARDYQVMILSDYPSANFTDEQLAVVAERVKNGMGLMMIGGWESYTGLGGDYHRGCLAEVLPVKMAGQDDRRNNWWPCVVVRQNDHEIISGLPLEKNLPCVGGFNAITARDGATTVLSIRQYEASRTADDSVEFAARSEVLPLLVTGQYGQGKVVCFASDVAPHWVGGLVDWGADRVVAQAAGGREVEVGNYYARLFRNMIQWAGKQEICKC